MKKILTAVILFSCSFLASANDTDISTSSEQAKVEVVQQTPASEPVAFDTYSELESTQVLENKGGSDNEPPDNIWMFILFPLILVAAI